MASNSTSYAVFAKARAKYGKRLTEKDYKNLLGCKTVAEVMIYLKSYTHYSTALKDINEHDVHRGMLEKLLSQKLFYEFFSLCSYETSIGSTFSTYVIRRFEVKLLINYLTLLNSNSTADFIFTFPAYFEKHSSINFTKLAKASDYDEFLAILAKSPYYEIVSQYKPNEKGRLPLAKIENQLYAFVFSNLFKGINKNCPKNEKSELLSYFNTILDYENFTRIIRLKKYYNMNPDEIKENLLPFGSLKKNQIEQLCSAENARDAFAVMSSFKQGSYIKKTSYFYTGSLAAKVKYKQAVKSIYYSSSPSAVMIAYMFAAETELANITCLIEGTRYNVDSKKIESLLIYQN